MSFHEKYNSTDDLADQPKVILCVAASDAHVVGNHMIAMYLRDHRFNVVNLGAATPISEMMEAYQTHRDAIAIVIGSLNGHAVDDLAGLDEAKRDYQVRCPIFVGGNLSVGSRKTKEELALLKKDGVTEIMKSPEQLCDHLISLVNMDQRQHDMNIMLKKEDKNASNKQTKRCDRRCNRCRGNNIALPNEGSEFHI